MGLSLSRFLARSARLTWYLARAKRSARQFASPFSLAFCGMPSVSKSEVFIDKWRSSVIAPLPDRSLAADDLLLLVP